MTITMSFCISAMDLDEILSSPTGYPFMQVFYNVTGTAGGATALTIFPIIFGFAGILTLMATSSRQLYAFARDNALPFSPWLAKVSSKEIPLNAILVTFTITSLLSLINLLVLFFFFFFCLFSFFFFFSFAFPNFSVSPQTAVPGSLLT